ncbi:hypothetical protein [Pedobacter miscanthi]|uniref:Uncharacterized protein n=1 Tax=Pedobacter miscanthi TaxID=2259170 RepID=A0A366L801_9SPHI|nr:hypothetical protein [Pedobacter miscanthi]RBQ09986.1 hypothetical protein DRW42_05990 [Pedobacter miscanthi]
MKNIWKILFVFTCISCHSNTQKKNKPVVSDTVKREAEVKKTADHQTPHQEIMEFVGYIDDGDYFLLTARRKNETLSFINDDNEDRNLLRGDIIEVTWKTDTIYVAGDGDTPQQAEKIVSVKKLKDGNVSKFRKNYNEALKYHWPQEEDYSKSYLDKLYTLVEYYIANSKNEQLQLLVKNRDEINYSIEKQIRADKEYMLIGIAGTEEHRLNTVQWLYFDNELDKLYEYDLPNDSLVEFDR